MARLFQLHYLVLELLGEFVVVDAVRSCKRADYLTLIFSMHCSAIALPGSYLTFLAFSRRSNILHGVSGVSGMHIFWLRMLPVMRCLLILILSIEAALMCLT